MDSDFVLHDCLTWLFHQAINNHDQVENYSKNPYKDISKKIQAMQPTKDERDAVKQLPKIWRIIRGIVRYWNANNLGNNNP